MIGTGMAPEGIEQNDFIYDLMSEMGWRSESVDLVAWTDSYAERRYGQANIEAKLAWRLLLSTVYNCSDDHADHNHGIPVVKPTSLGLQYSTWYDIRNVSQAWKHLISSGKDLQQSQTYRFLFVFICLSLYVITTVAVVQYCVHRYIDSQVSLTSFHKTFPADAHI